MDNMLLRSLEQELINTRNYWAKYTVDKENGGYYGQVNDDNSVLEQADKGGVLNCRILWFFSACYMANRMQEDLELAKRSYAYLKEYFVDKQFGGIYWSVDFKGRPVDSKKQIYAIAFAIYALAEYYKATKDEEALALGKGLYADIEKYSFDPINKGYFEAFSQQWLPLADLRLSDKDANEKKTMNTHLHILEAYSNLFSVWQDEGLAIQIRGLLTVFATEIIDEQTHHLKLFFDETWYSKYSTISFGHDIEAAWLLLEAAEILGDSELIQQFRALAVAMTKAAMRGLDEHGGLNYELEEHHWNKEKHWWVQAEAMVGFFNAFQITQDPVYHQKFVACWEFTKKYIIDKQGGEWFWGVNENLSLMQGHYKIGLWKCPYHNGRACIELIRRLQA